jgi:acyl-CoA dehydrogenase
MQCSQLTTTQMNIFGLEPVVKFGTKEQKDRMLPGLIAGTERSCFGVTEPNSGSDTLKLQTLATRKGDRYEINGRKMWISTAQVAQKILLLARTSAACVFRSRQN